MTLDTSSNSRLIMEMCPPSSPTCEYHHKLYGAINASLYEGFQGNSYTFEFLLSLVAF